MKVKVKITITETTNLDITEAEFETISKASDTNSALEDLFTADIYIGKEVMGNQEDIGGAYSIELLSFDYEEKELLEEYINHIRLSMSDHLGFSPFNPPSLAEWKKIKLHDCSLHLPKPIEAKERRIGE